MPARRGRWSRGAGPPRAVREAEAGARWRDALEKKLRLLPDRPGVYQFKSGRGAVLYVGKAKKLAARVRSYFQKGKLEPRTEILVSRVRDLDYIVTDNEVEALILEANLVREYQPRYNVNLKDDKRYPYLKLTMEHSFPRLVLTRRVEADGAKYYGPYTDVGSLRRMMRLIRTAFPLRSCTDRRLMRDDRECLYYFIHQCTAPCTFRIGREEYAEIVRRMDRFLSGEAGEVVDEIRGAMEAAAGRLDFETAARLRDRMQSMESVVQRQKVSRAEEVDEDYIGLAVLGDQAGVAVLRVREGRLLGKEQRFLTGAAGRVQPELLASFLTQFYLRRDPIPRAVVLAIEPQEREVLEEWLTQAAGHRVRLQVAKRGRPRGLLAMAAGNAHLAIEERALESNAERIDLAVYDLQKTLGLAAPPVRMECIDVSTFQGRDTVAACVVFENARARKGLYRRFRVKTVQGQDDFAAMREVVGRRLDRLVREERPLPELLVVDGGIGQVSAARGALEERSLSLPLIGLAKREETIVFADGRPVVGLLGSSPALRLLMRIRNEAHRFAVTYHRSLRGRTLTASEIDAVPGVGPVRRRRLLRTFGSVATLKRASVEEIARVEGVGRRAAEAVHRHLHGANGAGQEDGALE